jgi:hypothetical protein
MLTNITSKTSSNSNKPLKYNNNACPSKENNYLQTSTNTKLHDVIKTYNVNQPILKSNILLAKIR